MSPEFLLTSLTARRALTNVEAMSRQQILTIETRGPGLYEFTRRAADVRARCRRTERAC